MSSLNIPTNDARKTPRDRNSRTVRPGFWHTRICDSQCLGLPVILPVFIVFMRGTLD